MEGLVVRSSGGGSHPVVVAIPRWRFKRSQEAAERPTGHWRRDRVPEKPVPVVSRDGIAPVVGEALEARIFDGGQTAVAFADLVALVVATCGGGQRRGDAGDAEDRVP